jgi:two-component system response regulator MprA
VPIANGELEGRRLLVVDDEPPMRAALKRALELGGFGVTLAADGSEGLQSAEQLNPDLVVLDILMPGVDGLEVCRTMRARGDRTPILMLTARDAVADRVEGLEAGADDYLVKPFALEELVARIRALLRRLGPEDAAAVLRFADLELDTGTRDVRRGADPLTLTRTEFALLELFMRNPKQVLTRSVIFDRVWGYDFGYGSNSLDVYISYLRKKTEAAGKPRLIHTVRGVGYALREP